jgi:hypothetical protein
LDERVFVVRRVQVFDIGLVQLVADEPSFFGHHAVDVEYEAAASEVRSQVFA